jgi:flagellar biosynthesis component FlhA
MMGGWSVKNQNLILAVAVIFIVLVIIVPVSTVLLDLFLVVNITLSC